MNMPRQKNYSEMTTAELREATRRYDAEFAADKEARPLNAEQRAMHAQARRRGRPTVGNGSKKVMITVEKSLLDKADAFAKRNGLKRSEMIATGLRSMLAGRIIHSGMVHLRGPAKPANVNRVGSRLHATNK
jgi:hypothetical protein